MMYLTRPALTAPAPAWRQAATDLCAKLTDEFQKKLASEPAAHPGTSVSDQTRSVGSYFKTVGLLNLEGDENLSHLRLAPADAALWSRALASDEHASNLMIEFARVFPRDRTEAGAERALTRFRAQYRQADHGWTDGTAKLKITDCS